MQQELELIFYTNDLDLNQNQSFKINKIESSIGRNKYKNDIVLSFPEISDVHAKIIINDINDYSIKDINSESGVFRVGMENQKQRLKPGKEYDIGLEIPFYIGKYQCLLKEKINKKEITSKENKENDENKNEIETDQKNEQKKNGEKIIKVYSKKFKPKINSEDVKNIETDIKNDEKTIEKDKTNENEKEKDLIDKEKKIIKLSTPSKFLKQKNNSKEIAIEKNNKEELPIEKINKEEISIENNKIDELNVEADHNMKLLDSILKLKEKNDKKNKQSDTDTIKLNSPVPDLEENNKLPKNIKKNNKRLNSIQEEEESKIQKNEFEKITKKIKTTSKSKSPKKITKEKKKIKELPKINEKKEKIIKIDSPKIEREKNKSKFKKTKEFSAEKNKPDNILPKRRSPLLIATSGFKLEPNIIINLSSLNIKLIEEGEKPFKLLILDKFKRTIKLLISLNRGLPIIQKKWIDDCLKENDILDFSNYIFEDKEIEKKYNFKFKESIEIAKNNKNKGFLFGFNFWMPKTILPSPEEMKLLIISAGGTVLTKKPKDENENNLVIVSPDDKFNLEEFKDKGLKVYSNELILTGSLKQKLDLNEFILN